MLTSQNECNEYFTEKAWGGDSQAAHFCEEAEDSGIEVGGKGQLV